MTSNEKPSRSEQREAARDKARELRQQNVKKEKRNRLLLQVSVVFVALGIIGGVAAVVLVDASNRADAPIVGDIPENLTDLVG